MTCLYAVRGIFFVGVLALIAEASLAVKTYMTSCKRNKHRQAAAGSNSSTIAAADNTKTEPLHHPLDKQHQAARPKTPVNTSTEPKKSVPSEPRLDPLTAAAASALQRNPSPPPSAAAASTSIKHSTSTPALVSSSATAISDTTTTRDREQHYESRRRSTIDALQQQLNEDAEKAQKAEQERQQQRREETLRRLDEQLGTVQAAKVESPLAAELQAALDALSVARASAAAAHADRQLREEQDREYEESLAADKAKGVAVGAVAAADVAGGGSSITAASSHGGGSSSSQSAAVAMAGGGSTTHHKEQQQQPTQEQLDSLQQLKCTLQQSLGPEPEPSAPFVVTLRVRLPGGVAATRKFMPLEPFGAVEAWVQGLEGMPLWVPGSWRLASSYPRLVLRPTEDEAVIAEWRATAGVKGSGTEPQQERQRDGQDEVIGGAKRGVRGDGEEGGAAGVAGRSSEGGGEVLGGSDVVMVGSVQEVQKIVAGGASQLALFVMQV